jgi:magnesium-transporting ATPase (P-type)
MILEADIGIGIYGKEGVRAAQASDFAIHKFKYLWQLVFFHGRYNYIRISELILYFFFKNIVFTIPQLFFAFISDFSAQTVFDDWYISFYNLFFTALPIGARALFEMDINFKLFQGEKRKEIRSIYPSLYYVGQR